MRYNTINIFNQILKNTKDSFVLDGMKNPIVLNMQKKHS
jgi:hypothetical protein